MSNKVDSIVTAEDKLTRVTARQLIPTGILLEVNRQFFHPLGMALSLTVEQDGSDWDQPAELSMVQTDDPEGFVYGRSAERLAKAHAFSKLATEKRIKRHDSLGYIIQPLSEIEELPNADA